MKDEIKIIIAPIPRDVADQATAEEMIFCFTLLALLASIAIGWLGLLPIWFVCLLICLLLFLCWYGMKYHNSMRGMETYD